MQASIGEKLNDPDIIIQEFDTHLKLTDDVQQDDVMESESEEAMYDLNDGDYEEEEEDEEEEEFLFVCGGENASSPIAAEDAFVNGQIKPVYPLFDRELFFPGEDLPMRPPVKKVFVETNEENSNGNNKKKEMATSSDQEEIVGPYCEWSSRKAVEASPEACKKSNSTGFSKIWRFRDLMGRSNSDGRDAFVFLNNTHAPPSKAEEESVAEVNRGVIKKKKKSGGKIKTAVSAHEAYLRSKAKEEERRRSYLPYRPELVGFFTNVNSGLTKNVHPF